MYRDCVFAAVPAGNFNSSFNNAGNNANFWSSSQNSSNNAWNRNLNYSNAGVNRNNNNKNNGFSVRCLRDELKSVAGGFSGILPFFIPTCLVLK